MVVSRKSSALLLAAGLAILGTAGAANADISDIVFFIRAETPDGRFAEFEHRFDPQYYDPERGFYDWVLTAPVNMQALDGSIIAVINMAAETCNEDPEITLNFSVSAGAMSTVFTINSAVLGFGSAIVNPEARVTGSVNGTDLDDDGISIAPTGLTGLYSSHYNNPTVVGSGTTFRDLMLAGAVGVGSVAVSETYPLPSGSYVTVADTVDDMSAQFHFSLSGGDTATGTSFYRMQVPAPGALSLLGLAGLLVARRRR